MFTISDNKRPGAEYELKQIVEKKSGLLDDLLTEERQYEEKRLALERDLVDIETCEVVMR